jgi:hypothetical protein
VSPILVRPVREQLEHDRVIRLLHAKSRRRYEAAMNPGVEQNAAVGTGPSAVYPDLVLLSPERSRRLEAIVEVETGESVNHLEALSEWAHFAKLRTAFHLYVPSGMVDVARRLCEGNHIAVTEIWSYHSIGEDVRFTLIHRSKELPAPAPPRRTAPSPAASASARRKAAASTNRPATRAAKAAGARRKAAPVKKKAARTQKRK